MMNENPTGHNVANCLDGGCEEKRRDECPVERERHAMLVVKKGELYTSRAIISMSTARTVHGSMSSNCQAILPLSLFPPLLE